MAAKRRWSERMLLVTNLAIANVVAGVWIATFLQPSVLGSADQSGTERALVMPLQTIVGLLYWGFVLYDPWTLFPRDTLEVWRSCFRSVGSQSNACTLVR